MINNIYQRQATEALQILSKENALTFVYNPLSDYIHYLERDLNNATDKLHRRNVQIADLKQQVEELKHQASSYSIMLGKLGYNLNGEKVY